VLEMSVALFLILILTFGVLDWAWVFFVRNTMYHAAREAARAMAVQEMTTAEGQAVAQEMLDAVHAGQNFQIQISNGPDPEISVDISLPVRDAGLSGLTTFTSADMTASVMMIREGL